MRDDGCEKEQSRHDSQTPAQVVAPLRVVRAEMPGERKSDQKRDDEPTVMQSDLHTEDASKFYLRSNVPPPGDGSAADTIEFLRAPSRAERGYHPESRLTGEQLLPCFRRGSF